MRKDKIYIYGGNGHGLVVADIAIACGYKNIIFVDDGDNYHVSFEEIKKNKHIPIIIGIGDNNIRSCLFQKIIDNGFELVTLIHPSAVISPSSNIDIGTVVMPNVVVNAMSKIGKCAILNTSCIVEHENQIGDFIHISPAVALSGNVIIKNFTHIGVNSAIKQGVTIGEDCIIGVGSVVLKDIGNNKVCFGNPCKIIRNNI